MARKQYRFFGGSDQRTEAARCLRQAAMALGALETTTEVRAPSNGARGAALAIAVADLALEPRDTSYCPTHGFGTWVCYWTDCPMSGEVYVQPKVSLAQIGALANYLAGLIEPKEE